MISTIDESPKQLSLYFKHLIVYFENKDYISEIHYHPRHRYS